MYPINQSIKSSDDLLPSPFLLSLLARCVYMYISIYRLYRVFILETQWRQLYFMSHLFFSTHVNAIYCLISVELCEK